MFAGPDDQRGDRVPRSPLHLAHAAYDLHELSGGRFRLGLGSQVRAHVEKRYGATWGRPVEHMREIVQATKAILDGWQEGRPINVRGEYTTHTLMTPIFDPGPNPFGVPKVLVGALGPRMNRMAAEVADGILVMPFNTERHMRERTEPAIEAGTRGGGPGAHRHRADRRGDRGHRSHGPGVGWPRTQPGPSSRSTGRRPPTVRCSRSKVGATYSPSSTRSRSVGLVGHDELVDDEMFRTIAVRGTPEECAAQIVGRFGGCDRVCAYFPGYVAAGRPDRGVRRRGEGRRMSGVAGTVP